MNPVDFRSDTVTQPTPEMREAMQAAPLGDDVLEGDPSVRALEARLADLLGKEAALFVPSGTMANLLAIKCQTNPGEEVICDQECHIYYYEAAGYSAFCGVSPRFTRGARGLFTADELEALIRPLTITSRRRRWSRLRTPTTAAGASPGPSSSSPRCTASPEDMG